MLYFVLFFAALVSFFKFVLKSKTMTFHICLAGPIYWRFTASTTEVTKRDRVTLWALGPVSCQLVRTIPGSVDPTDILRNKNK